MALVLCGDEPCCIYTCIYIYLDLLFRSPTTAVNYCFSSSVFTTSYLFIFYFIFLSFITMKAFMTSGSVICPFFYAFFLFSLPTAVLCQIPVPSPSASVNVLNSGLPHHQSTFISVGYLPTYFCLIVFNVDGVMRVATARCVPSQLYSRCCRDFWWRSVVRCPLSDMYSDPRIHIYSRWSCGPERRIRRLDYRCSKRRSHW